MTGLRLALPKGWLLGQTRALLDRSGLGFEAYVDGGRHYRLESSSLRDVTGKVFQERDVPIQVAIGNYDLGICGCQWIQELTAGYPLAEIIRVMDLGYGAGSVLVVASELGRFRSCRDLWRSEEPLRLVSEYPNLAESIALRLRLRRFKVLPLWGAAEAYPPENSEAAVVWRSSTADLGSEGLLSLMEAMHGGACLVANRRSWQCKDLGGLVARICQAVRAVEEYASPVASVQTLIRPAPAPNDKDYLWLALPDGHQQGPAARFLNKAGVSVEGYSAKTGNRYPGINLPGIKVKVIRPQDMPMQVANGNFDLAVTGRDWLADHKSRFPGSPVEEVLDLGFGRVRIVAAIDGREPVEDLRQLRKWMGGRLGGLRVASEYVNLADRFAREHHLVPYRVIPTWGATEAFIPEDADLLIENTETGRTLAEHNLRVVDTLAVSTACLVGNSNAILSAEKRARIALIIEAFKKGLAG